MKGIRLFFAVLLVPLAFQAAFANDEVDTSRAATRRGTTNTVLSNRQKPNTSDAKATPQQSNPTSRTVNIGKSDPQPIQRERSTGKQTAARTGNVISRTGTTPQQNKSVSARTASSVQQRIPSSSSSRVATRASAPNQSGLVRSGVLTRAATGSTARKSARNRSATMARSGTTTPSTIDTIQSRNYSACRDIFFECMDEFCANKDSSLKRCACSARIHDFDKTKQQLSKIEDKLLDFSQRLLTVSMDQEDALAINTATEGEVAYAVDDTSKSKKMLDDIAKKLNASFDNSNFDQSLNAISLSLNTDAAFDNIDSMMGASTTTKSGTDLYRAALPVCREMALEVCSDDDLAIAESGYQLAIDADCNTVEKSYETQNDQARAKIKESSALLDMSRLNTYQERNSDDILTCKSKMLDMLTDTTVCGENMSKCLDYTGQYIDPTTGEAFLTENLANLNTLITRPAPDETWTKASGNDKFVLFLQSKKVYLEPAMENCQDISTYVWDAFIEDALAQIKLAQEAKLEQVRRSCTTLTAQCLDTANKNISDFDARALSIFGVNADKTVNAMCSDIKTTCTALMNASDEIIVDGETTNDWTQGITEITTDKTYETLLATCREVGKNCIIQACTDISGNFGLCTNIDTSINRKSIVSRRSCWAEVEQCVRDAGEQAIAQIIDRNGYQYENVGDNIANDTLYKKMYLDKGIELINTNEDPDNPVCREENNQVTCTEKKYKLPYQWDINGDTAFDKQVHRLTEQVWGNCENVPNPGKNSAIHNRIIINYVDGATDNSDETLLSWFARNTNTTDATDSCRDTTCGYGFTEHDGKCVSISEFTRDGLYCPDSTDNTYNRIMITNNNNNNTEKWETSNCCSKIYNTGAEYMPYSYSEGTDDKDILDHYVKDICCILGKTSTDGKYDDGDATAGDATAGIYPDYATTRGYTMNNAPTICIPYIPEDAKSPTRILAFSTDGTDYYCFGGTLEYEENALKCNGGRWVSVTNGNQYAYPTSANTVIDFHYNNPKDNNDPYTPVTSKDFSSGAMIGTPNTIRVQSTEQ